jgi:hypothetical protein
MFSKPGEDYGERDDNGKANKQTVPRLSSPQFRAGLTVLFLRKKTTAVVKRGLRLRIHT